MLRQLAQVFFVLFRQDHARDGLNNAPRRRPDVRPAMPAQLGFIIHATQAHALERLGSAARGLLCVGCMRLLDALFTH